MNRRQKTGLLAVLLVGVLSLMIWAWHEREPVYEGRRLSAWLADLDFNKSTDREGRDHAAQAVRAIGTNAFPRLMRMLRTSDPFWKSPLLRIAAKQSAFRIRLTSARLTQSRALLGYAALGARAKENVPALIQLMEAEKASGVRAAIASALGAIGPEAQAAVPVLARACNDPNPDVRNNCLLALAEIRRVSPAESSPR